MGTSNPDLRLGGAARTPAALVPKDAVPATPTARELMTPQALEMVGPPLPGGLL